MTTRRNSLPKPAALLADAEVIARFRQNVTVKPNGCHKWTGPVRKNKRGIVCFGGRGATAHAFAWMVSRGAWPEEGRLVVYQTCGNVACVNPCHMTDEDPEGVRCLCPFGLWYACQIHARLNECRL
jgi:hypothetical protein